jgi:hypothetical protein
VAAPDEKRGFWGRGTLAVALALYGWLMMAVFVYLRGATPADERSVTLVAFRRDLMSTGLFVLGAASIAAATILALLAARGRAWSAAALALAAGWIALALRLLGVY